MQHTPARTRPPRLPTRRASLTLLRSAPPAPAHPAPADGPKPATQRTSKTHQRLVELPSAPQTQPLPSAVTSAPTRDAETHGYATEDGKSAAERMGKPARARAGCRRLAAYCVADALRAPRLASFLKREHNVVPRAFDEALYAMYQLPLLPGYGPAANVRASAPRAAAARRASRLSEAEADGYTGSYFAPGSAASGNSGYMTSPPPPRAGEGEERPRPRADDGDGDGANEEERRGRAALGEDAAEAVFFAYGVVVFMGFEESAERAVLEDLQRAGALRGARPEAEWEVEECHFAYDPTIASPRIYNDFFTFKAPSHLLTLSLSHALAQSTLLAHYESQAHALLSHPRTRALPTTLARTGALALPRRAAMRLTGALFRLRRDVVLGRNVLDVPRLFWEEASLRALYEAGRAYFEIGERVEGLSERIGGASELLDVIHEHLNNSAMERITWIIIWLIVVAILVELGEIIARLTVHSTLREQAAAAAASALAARVPTLEPGEALRAVRAHMALPSRR
ncbi:hypothetical protein BC834DRAFT_1032727 [Gloeopeniophorella convolvens]|nr:hypothetical protein BC834DRAFT_1032727 [Gloeopeniophorella convolvens]